MKPIRMLCAAILALTGLVAVGLTTEAANAASSKDLTVNYTKVMKSETFYAYGNMSTHVARTVKLQYRNHDYGPWTTKTTMTSASNGYFEFSPSTTKTRYWRYYAPATASFASIKGNSRKVTVVAQKSVDLGGPQDAVPLRLRSHERRDRADRLLSQPGRSSGQLRLERR